MRHTFGQVGIGMRTVTCVVILWLIAPTLVVIPLSFTDRDSFQFPPPGWSLNYYRTFFTDPSWHAALVSSVEVAVSVAVLATMLGICGALALDRISGKHKAPLNGIMLAPTIVPAIIIAVGVYAVFLRWHLVGTYVGFIAAHTVLALPFPVVTVLAGLRTFDRTMLRAAESLGAPPFKAFVAVLLPHLIPTILAGAAFAFITSFDEVVVALFIQSSDFRTLPVQMWTSVTSEIDPTIASAATIVIFLSTLFVVISQSKPWVVRRKAVEQAGSVR